jgi:hypothetical protein
MSTDEWRRQYAPDGYVDLWVEEEFNAGSRVVVRSRVRSVMLRALQPWRPVWLAPALSEARTFSMRRGAQGAAPRATQC